MSATITVDVGTTSVKLGVRDAHGGAASTTVVTTPTRRDDLGEVYDVPALMSAFATFVRELQPDVRAAVERVALAGVGESGGLVRSDLTLASPVIVWHDQRGARRLDELDDAERRRVYRVTGLPVSGNYALSKVAWALDDANGAVGDAQWLNVVELMAAMLTGVRWAEWSLASRTMALDLGARSWSREVCALLGVDVSVFPPIRTAADGEPLRAETARELGLPAAVTVHVVGHDHMVGAVGADLTPGELLNSTGTTEGLLVLRDAPETGPRQQAAKLANGVACRGSDTTLFASIPTGGAAFAALGSLLSMSPDRLAQVGDRALEQYRRHGVGSDVPLVLPTFRGSPPPDKNPAARASVTGLGPRTTSVDLVLGCYLGMARQFLEVLELFPARDGGVKVIGPAARNPLWMQVKADLLGRPLGAAEVPEVVSLGAQALACGSTPRWDDLSPSRVLPDDARHRRLQQWRSETERPWADLKGLCA